MKSMLCFLSVVVLGMLLCIPLAYVQESNGTKDPIVVIWSEFMNSSDRLEDIDEWVEKILLVVEQNPTSQARERVLRGLAASCNSANRYEKSIELLLKALPMADSAFSKLSIVGQLGAVHGLLRGESLSRGDRQAADKHAEAILMYYKQYAEELDSSTEKDLSEQERFKLQQNLVFYKRTEANLLKDVKGDVNAALKKQDEALALLKSNPDLTQRGILQGMGLDTAFFLKNKAQTLLAKDLQTAIANLIEFGKSPSSSKEIKSLIAREFAEDAFPQRRKEYRDFLNRWFHEVPHDRETVVVLRDIGKSYFDEELYEKSIEVLENIRSSWWQQALDLDPIALREQRGGYFTDVLRMLCISYQKTGQLDKAAQCLDELKKLVPKDVWAERLERHQEIAVAEYEQADIQRKFESGELAPHRRWGIIIGVNLVMIILIIYLLWRKKWC